jgi:hypothetical protein
MQYQSLKIIIIVIVLALGACSHAPKEPSLHNQPAASPEHFNPKGKVFKPPENRGRTILPVQFLFPS